MASSTEPVKSIALFGGSFDPPHFAHVRIVQSLLESQEFDEVWVLPTFHHPEKTSVASFEQRLEMCRLAFAGQDSRIQILDWEKVGSGFTVDLLQELHRRFPNHRWTLVLGSDLQGKINSWKEPETIHRLTEIRFVPRSEEATSRFGAWQSSELRTALLAGDSVSEALPEAVAKFIHDQKIYTRR